MAASENHSPNDKAAKPTVGGGVILLVVLLVAFAATGAIPSQYLALDAFGVEAEGRVVAHDEYSIGSFTSGTLFHKVSVYRFALPDGQSVMGRGLFEGNQPPPVGTAVTVRYLPLLPGVNAYGYRHWTSPIFLFFLASFLIIGGLIVALIGKIATLIKEG